MQSFDGHIMRQVHRDAIEPYAPYTDYVNASFERNKFILNAKREFNFRS